MTRILVTGAAGFIGSNLCDYLQAQGHEVTAVDNYSTGRSENLASFILAGGKVRLEDIRHLSGMFEIFMEAKPEVVIHFAANASISLSEAEPSHDLMVNGIGTLNMIHLCNKLKVKKFIFSSTSAVYAETDSELSESSEIRPASPYGVSKMAAEMYIRSCLENYVIFRFSNIYGPRQQPIGENQLIARAIRHFKYGDDFSVNGKGDQKRDFLYVGDVIQAISNVLMGGIKGTFNLGFGKSVTVNDVLGTIEQLYEVRGYPWLHNTNCDPRKIVRMNVSAIKHKLGWKPSVSLLEGIRCTKQWWDEK